MTALSITDLHKRYSPFLLELLDLGPVPDFDGDPDVLIPLIGE